MTPLTLRAAHACVHRVVDRLAVLDAQEAASVILAAAVDTLGGTGGVVLRDRGGTLEPVAWHGSGVDLADGTATVSTPVPAAGGSSGVLAVVVDPATVGEHGHQLLRVLAAQCAVAFRAGSALDALHEETRLRTAELEARNAALDEERAALDAFVVYKEAIGTESDVVQLARQAIDVVLATLDHVSAGYYEREGDVWRAKAWSPDVPPAIVAQIRAGVPVTATHFAEATRTRDAVFVDRWSPDQEGLTGGAAFGTTAFVPLVIQGEARSVFAVGVRDGRVWGHRERAIVRAVARGLRLTLERSEQQRQLEVERAALTAFARLSELSAETEDVTVLAHEAARVLRATLGDVSVSYLEPGDGRWHARVWSEEHPPEVVRALQAGVPMDAPTHAEALRSGTAVFVPDWAAGPAGVPGTEMYGSAALFPYVLAGEPRGLLAMGSRHVTDWTERERQVFRAVGRSLGVALERAATLHARTAQADELAARTRALEGFAELTRDFSLHSDPYALVRRAQALVMSLLPPGYAVYYEPDGRVWRLRAQTGSLRNDALQQLVDAGLPYDDVQNLVIPFTSGQPFYQELYERTIDNLAEYVDHLGASATLPVLVEGHARGVFAVVLFGEVRRWSAADRAVMETVVRSLGLALEGAQGLSHLRRAMDELERSNRELERFAYVASHDLQEPLRSVTSFTELLLRRYPADDPKLRTYAEFIRAGTARMGHLIQDLLSYSRVTTAAQPAARVDAGEVVAGVVHDLADLIERTHATVTVDDLPSVTGDRVQVRQVFQNLLGNALKFTAPGRAPVVRVSGVREGTHVRFAVQDNGIGIDPAYHARIFEIFQQLHPRHAYEGTGIGLSTARRIVERYGGTIEVHSVVDEGTTMTFTLPAHDPLPT